MFEQGKQVKKLTGDKPPDTPGAETEPFTSAAEPPTLEASASLPLPWSLPTDIQSLLALAVAKGLDFPLYVAVRTADGEGAGCVFSSMGTISKCIHGEPISTISPYWTAVCGYRQVEPGEYKPQPPGIVIERGHTPEWRPWTYRRPRGWQP